MRIRLAKKISKDVGRYSLAQRLSAGRRLHRHQLFKFGASPLICDLGMYVQFMYARATLLELGVRYSMPAKLMHESPTNYSSRGMQAPERGRS